MKKLFLLISITFLFISCQKETPAPQFEELNVEEISSRDCDPEEENCAYISINIPWAKENDVRDRTINNHIERHVIQLIDFQEENNFSSLESLAQNFIDNYEATAQEYPEYSIPWEASVAGSILYTSPEIVSLEFDLALFTGGAHGFTSTSYLNFNPETGESYSNRELFKPEFKAYAEELFRKRHDIPAGEPINSTGFFFEDDAFQLPQNIGFHSNKIILHYNAYEVASYAEGGIQIAVPREEAQEYIKIF